MAKELEKLSLSDIIPGSIAGDENVQAAIQGIDPELQSVSRDIAEALIYSRIDELPEPVLDALAWQWHVDFYELAHSVEGKREVVKGALQWHRKKGTVWSILKALEMFGIKGTYTNWYEMEPSGKPYTFALDAELTDEFWKRSDWNDPASVVRRAIVESKAKRSFMESLYIHRDSQSRLDIVSATVPVQGIRHDIDIAPHREGTTALNFVSGMATVRRGTHSIALSRHTEGKGRGELVSGVATAQGLRHTVAIKPHDKGIAEPLRPQVATATVRRGTHEIRLKQVWTGARNNLGWRGVAACGIRITIGAASLS